MSVLTKLEEKLLKKIDNGEKLTEAELKNLFLILALKTKKVILEDGRKVCIQFLNLGTDILALIGRLVLQNVNQMNSIISQKKSSQSNTKGWFILKTGLVLTKMKKNT